MPDEQTGLTGHGQSRATQRLPLQSAHRPLAAVLQRRRRRAAAQHSHKHILKLQSIITVNRSTSNHTSGNQKHCKSCNKTRNSSATKLSAAHDQERCFHEYQHSCMCDVDFIRFMRCIQKLLKSIWFCFSLMLKML